MLILDSEHNVLHDPDLRLVFDPARRRWLAAPGAAVGRECSWQQAAAWLQRGSGHPVRAPVAVVGPRHAGAEELATAKAIGSRLGEVGLAVVCGGRQGVMEAVCRGADEKGGISIGLLPGIEPDDANPHVTVRIATGIGEARNAIIARAGFCIVAIGNSYGTLSEVALGLQFGRRVFGLCGAARLDGVLHCDDADAAIDAVCRLALAYGEAESGRSDSG
jgi:uncharacterized protein (TIGR00725 family)